MTQKGKQDPTCGDEDTVNSAAHLISAPFYGSRKKKMDPLSLAKHLHGMQVLSAIITQEDYTTSRFDSVAVAAAAAAVAVMLRTMLPLLLLLLLLLLPMLLSAMDLLLDLIHHSSLPFLVVLLLLAVLITMMLVVLLVFLLLVVSSNVELLLDLMDNP
ncbi:unnamed protein product [Musa acuminata subsp. burmannicoides]